MLVSANRISPQITDIESPFNTGDNLPSPLTETEEGRMPREEDFMVIHALAKCGLYLCGFAEQVGVHPRTVRRALSRGGAPAPRPSRWGSRLDPYRVDIDRLLAEDVWNTVVIFRELQAKGYTGRLSILRDYIRPKRALRVRRGTCGLRLSPAGSSRAIGPSTGRGLVARRPRSISSFTPWASRGAFTSGARMASTPSTPSRGLIPSFKWFGGVRGEVLVDNQKAAVLEHPVGGPARFHPRFVDLADHMGLCHGRAGQPAPDQGQG